MRQYVGELDIKCIGPRLCYQREKELATAEDYVLHLTLLNQFKLLGRVETMLVLSAAEVGDWDNGLIAG